MHRQFLSNRWIAIFFVLLVSAGAASLVGTEDSEGAIDRAAQQIAANNAEFERASAELSQPRRAAVDAPIEMDETSDTEFASDEELIDMAEGFDTDGLDPSPDLPELTERDPGVTRERRLAGPDEGVMLSLDDDE